jgi:choline dehydrogenase-like flavoprotein
MSDYDVIIIGTGAGGGTLARHLAPSGKRILLLERGGWLAREPQNWSTADVFIDGRYISPDTWYDAKGKTFPRRPQPNLTGQQEGQDHRGEDRAGHVPARFPETGSGPTGSLPRSRELSVGGPVTLVGASPYLWRRAIPHAPDHEAPGPSRITSMPDANAFGGHVIGSIAMACRRLETGSRVSPV